MTLDKSRYSMRLRPSDFCRLFFLELQRLDIPFVLLFSGESIPEQIDSDIDYAVRTSDLARLPGVQRTLAERHGWKLAHAVEAHIYAYYAVVVDPEDPRKFLQLDACGHYVERNCFFFSDANLLEGRKRVGEFFAPAPAVEFAYLLVKALAKGKPVAPRLSRLRELWQRDPDGVENRFRQLFGTDQGPLADWFAKPAVEWEQQLCPLLLAGHRFGFPDRCREAWRAWKRTIRPTGLHLAVLGSDGSGKSTLLERIGPMIQGPFFRRQLLLHFRPKVFERQLNERPVTDPHGRPPRPFPAAIAKLLYYFADSLLGHFARVLPAKVRNELVIFDRSFDDVVVDPRRYRFAKAGKLARCLRRLLPRADLTVVLDASPEQIRARKPELSLEELRRQNAALRELARSDSRYVLVSSAEPPDEVANVVCRRVVQFLTEREDRRR